jgi:L-lactate dehydrogenase complex protein LldF
LITKSGHAPTAKTIAMKGLAAVLGRPALFKLGGGMARLMMRFMPVLFNNRLDPWYKNRELPAPPKQSFTAWYAKNRKKP